MKDKIIKLRKEGKSYREIQKQLRCSKSTISYHCQKLNINSPVEFIPKLKSGEYVISKNKRSCIICNSDISLKPYRQKTCSTSCGSKKKNLEIYNEYIFKWKKGEEKGGDEKYGKISGHVRKYLFIKYDNKCACCGWSKINEFTKTIPLEVDHIDGNPTNHKEDNLILICPNCHSLTPGHSTSKGNGRRYYREKYKGK